jgi:hypothetical protein
MLIGRDGQDDSWGIARLMDSSMWALVEGEIDYWSLAIGYLLLGRSEEQIRELCEREH